MSRKPAKTAQEPRTRPVGGITMRQALTDPELLGGVLAGESWRAWRILLIAAMGEALTDDERIIFQKLTARAREPGVRCLILLVVAGRRGGKSRAISCLVVYLAIFFDHGAKLAPGERGVLLCLAQNRQQAKVVFGYVTGIFEAVPLLAGLVENQTAESLSLTNGVEIEVRSASFRGLRGITAIGVVCDEAAFWYDEASGSQNSDTEILDAVGPALATTGGPLVIISSPYAKRGVVFEIHARDYGEKGDPRILVAQGASRDFNESLPQRVVDDAMEKDAAAASSEYLGLFRTDISALIDRETIEACVSRGVSVRAPLAQFSYVGGVDPSGGSGSDSFTMAIAHLEDGVAVLDCVLERKPPLSPEAVTAEFAAVLKEYRVSTVRGDRYAGLWPADRFRAHSISYEPSDLNRSEVYLAFWPMLTSGKVDLLDHQKMISQFVGLERRTARSGRDSVDSSPNQHEDIANSVALALTSARASASSYWANNMAWVRGDDETETTEIASPRVAGLPLFNHPFFRGFH